MSNDDDNDDPNIVNPGRFYGRRRPHGPLEQIVGDPGRAPDLWICRRVADYPSGLAPRGSAIALCARCGALIAYNPARLETVPAGTPKVCMQCAAITPLPIT